MKKLILDYSTWRCGGNDLNKLGIGDTCLINKEGFMCCLGQFSLQLSKVTKGEMLAEGEPSDLPMVIPDLSEFDDGSYYSTVLSDDAIGINDNPNTTPSDKVKELKTLFSKSGYEIEVVSQPAEVVA